MEEQKTHVGVKIVGMIIIGIVLVVAILQQAILPSTNTVTVIGQGKIPVTPDIAVLYLSIATIKAATTEEALNQTTQKVQKVQTALDELGIVREDQQITGYAFNPIYEGQATEDGVTTGNKIVGYNGLQEITVKVRGIDQNKELIDQLIQRVVKEGVTQIGTVNFVYSNIEKAKQQAREMAIADAKTKAQSMQKNVGVKMGKIAYWSENLLAVPGQSYPEGNYTSSSYNSISFNNENSPISGSSNNLTEVVVEISMNYSVR